MQHIVTVHLPPGLCGDVGEPLPAELSDLICSMAGICYAPVDFGEDNGETVEFLFTRVDDLLTAGRIGEQFLLNHGAPEVTRP